MIKGLSFVIFFTVMSLGSLSRAKTVSNLKCAEVFANLSLFEKRYIRAQDRLQILMASEDVRGPLQNIDLALQEARKHKNGKMLNGAYSEIKFIDRQLAANNSVRILKPEKEGGKLTADFLINGHIFVELKSFFVRASTENFLTPQTRTRINQQVSTARKQIKSTIEKAAQLAEDQMHSSHHIKSKNQIYPKNKSGVVYFYLDIKKHDYLSNKKEYDDFYISAFEYALSNNPSVHISGLAVVLIHNKGVETFSFASDVRDSKDHNESIINEVLNGLNDIKNIRPQTPFTIKEPNSFHRKRNIRKFNDELAEEVFVLSSRGGSEKIGTFFEGTFKTLVEVEVTGTVTYRTLKALINKKMDDVLKQTKQVFDYKIKKTALEIKINSSNLNDNRINSLLKNLSIKAKPKISTITIWYNNTPYKVSM